MYSLAMHYLLTEGSPGCWEAAAATYDLANTYDPEGGVIDGVPYYAMWYPSGTITFFPSSFTDDAYGGDPFWSLIWTIVHEGIHQISQSGQHSGLEESLGQSCMNDLGVAYNWTVPTPP